MIKKHQYDVLIIGSGAAGLMSALHLNSDLQIALLSKNDINSGSTAQAQGGISAVLSDSDSFEQHIVDTINSGAGLCNPEVVKYVVENAPLAINKLSELGVGFTTENNSDEYHLTKEGGHTKRRVVHKDDHTGKAIANTLSDQVLSKDNIKVFVNHSAIDLISSSSLDNKSESTDICGAYVLDIDNDKVVSFSAKAIILATGGASKVYLYTSNPDGSTGDGISMAWRAGCDIANMEFNQFHPTCLFHPHAKSFLISEAVRGEGGKLYLPDGTRFMPDIDERAELAPRDIVARAIDNQMKRLGVDNVLLDISFKSSDFIKQHFPVINAKVKKFGMDMTTDMLPVVPAAHYTCGGVVVDLKSKTKLNNLYAVGEVSSTGFHGANRMASNSLLECLVFAKSAADDINANIYDREFVDNIPEWDSSRVTNSDEMVVVSHNWEELRRFMWDYVGIVRTNKRLYRAQSRVKLLQQEIDEYYNNFKVHAHLLELRNLVQVASIMIESALQRKESRGLHYNLDYTETHETACDTILSRRNNE